MLILLMLLMHAAVGRTGRSKTRRYHATGVSIPPTLYLHSLFPLNKFRPPFSSFFFSFSIFFLPLPRTPCRDEARQIREPMLYRATKSSKAQYHSPSRRVVCITPMYSLAFWQRVRSFSFTSKRFLVSVPPHLRWNGRRRSKAVPLVPILKTNEKLVCVIGIQLFPTSSLFIESHPVVRPTRRSSVAD